MAKIFFYGAVSLDGYLSDVNDGLQWLFDTEVGDKLTTDAFLDTVETVVMGRITYEEARKYVQPLYPGKDVVVFTHNTNFDVQEGFAVSEDPVDYLRKLKEQPSGNIWVVGGVNLLKNIIVADLIDKWWIQIAPVLLGNGKRLFEQSDYQTRLELIDITQMKQLTELHFHRN